VSFEPSAPAAGTSAYLQDPSIQLLVDFFRNKGLEALKQEDRQEDWYQDWIDYQANHRLYASVLSPQAYSSLGHRFNVTKLTRFLEVFAYFSPAHGYSLHVSFLGLFPILMSSNEALKKEAIAKLEKGGLFAFAVSEQAHGSDLLTNEFSVQAAPSPLPLSHAASDMDRSHSPLPLSPASAEGGPGTLRADGAKYYIGNVNAACMISVLAKKSQAESGGTAKRMPFVFFALRPQEAPAFQNVRKIRTLGIRPAFVGGFEVKGHTFPESDVISQGRAAWEAVFSTIIFGKFFLGFGAIGICEHAFAEAVAHMHRRILFGKRVTEMPHLRTALVAAFARLTAMKLYAYRALDYVQVASAAERRYLLWSAVQKARVSTEGVKVMALLSECIGARGFEAETYFELALRDVPLIPALESSTHINFGLTAQFIDSYFSGAGSEAPPPEPLLHATDPGENPYWMEAADRNAKTVRFAHFLKAYEPLRVVPNVASFMTQVQAFQRFAAGGISALNPAADAELLIEMGKCFSVIAHAQLVAENCLAAAVPPSVASVIFRCLIEDLSAAALKLAALFAPDSASRPLLQEVVRVPETAAPDVLAVSELIAARYFAQSS
jgi:acyl-CoA dehydrogenase